MLDLTIHSRGKMVNMVSLNTSTLNNTFCQSMRQRTGLICSKCYAARLEAFRHAAKDKFSNNADILSSAPISDQDIPIINRLCVRFHSFGELINRLHYRNLVKIAEKNPEVMFSLWTKRPNLVDTKIKPDNMILIYSSPMLNTAGKRPAGFNKVFTVYDRDHAGEVDINCSEVCFNCRLCYSHNGVINVNERLR